MQEKSLDVVFEHAWMFWRINTRHRHPKCVELEAAMAERNADHLERIKREMEENNGVPCRDVDDQVFTDPPDRKITDAVFALFLDHIKRKGVTIEQLKDMDWRCTEVKRMLRMPIAELGEQYE
jgi:hypothetical protein